MTSPRYYPSMWQLKMVLRVHPIILKMTSITKMVIQNGKERISNQQKNCVKMKKLYYIAITLCSLLAVSCENIELNDGLETQIDENAILIYAAGDDATRAYIGEVGADGEPSKIVWDAGDQVGVYVQGPAVETNRCFTSLAGAGVASATFKGSFENKATTGNFTYYAYSPYTATAGTNYAAVAGYLSPTQIQTDAKGSHIGKQMLEIAKPVSSDNNKGNVDMKFTNKFALLNFKIKYGTRAEDATLAGAKVTGLRVYIANPRVSDDDPFIPLYDRAYRLAGAYTANLATGDVTFSNDSYAWIIDLQMNQANATVNSTSTDGALDAWVVVSPVADLTGKKLVAEITTDKGIFITSRSIKSNKLAANTVYVMPATIKVPKVTPQVYPLWTEGNNFFSTCKYNEDDALSLGSAIELKPSNCFMVKPNTLYKFKANIRGRGAAGVAAMGITSGTQIVGDYAINSDGSISSVMDDKDYIYFKTTTTGNGVISLYFGGTVLWSWHVWSMNDTPSAVSVGNGIQMLDRNLGAKAITTRTSTVNFDLYGLYYCWGFNVPYPGISRVTATNGVSTSSWYNKKLNNIYYYNSSNTGTLTEERLVIPSGSLATATMQPQAPAYLMANDDKNVATDPFLRMWGYKGNNNENSYDKTVFDPCPYGYRMPSYYDYAAITSVAKEQLGAGIELTYMGGSTYFIPQGIVGCEASEDGNVNAWYLNFGGFNYMWTATPAYPAESTNALPPVSSVTTLSECTNGRAMSRVLWPDDRKTTNYAMRRYQGAPVRCVKYADEQ